MIKIKEVEKKPIGKINNEDIECFNVYGIDQGFVKGEFRSLKEVYEFIQDLKKSDKYNGFKESCYYVEIETEKSAYKAYTVSKYGSKYKLKYNEDIAMRPNIF